MLGTQKAWIHSVFTGTMWQEWRGRSGAPSTTLFRLFLTDRNKSELFCELKEKRKSPVFRLKLGFFGGAGGGTRTHTVSLPTDFESVTSTNSITPASNACLLYKMQIRNSRGDLKLAENCTTDGKGDCAHRKMNRPLKTMENRKKDYTNGGKRAIIYQLKYAHQPDLRMRRCQEGGGGL